MSDISGQLIKDSYSYILQVDTSTGYVYRVNGNVPVNPIFSSGLTVFSAFTFVDGNQSNGYVLTSDANGNSRWAAVSGASVSSVTASTGLSGNSTTGAITLINTAPDKTVTISGGTGISTGGTYPNFSIVNTAPDQTVTITGGTNIEITGVYPDFGVNFTGTTSGEYLPLSGGTVTGDTIFEYGLTANTLTITGLTSATDSNIVTIDNEGTLHTYPTSGLTGTDGSNTRRFMWAGIGDNVRNPGTFVNGGSDNLNFTDNYLHFSYDYDYYGNPVSTWFDIAQYWTSTHGGDKIILQLTKVGDNSIIGQYFGISYIQPVGVDVLVKLFGTIVATNYTLQVGELYSFSWVLNGADGSGTVNSVTAGSGLSGDTTTGDITLINTAPDQTVVITGGTNIEVISNYPNFGINFTGQTSSAFTGGTVSGATDFTNGLTANTISATTYYNVNAVTGGTYSNGTITLSGTGNFASTITGFPNSFPYLPLSGGTMTGDTIFQSGFTANTLTVTGNTLLSGLTASTISATTYYNVSLNFQYEIHVSQVDGSDTTGNGTLLNPVASITKGLTLVDSQRKTVIVHPGTYTESPSITVKYTTITGPGLIGGNIVIAGTVSTNNGCTISGIKMTNLTITASAGTGNVNILNCEVSGTLTKSSNSDYTLIRFCDIGTTNITGGNLVAIFGGNPNFITVNGASARVIVKNAVTVAPVLTAGGLTFADSIILSTGATSNAFTTAAGTLTTLANSQIIVPTFDNVARVSLSGFYSILNCVFDKPNSTLVALSATGGSTNSIDYFQFINADKFITQGGTSLQYVMGDGSLSNGFTGGTVSGATNFTNGLTANTISATTYYNVNAVTGGTYSNGAITLSGTGSVNGNTITGFPTSLTGDYLPLSGGTVTGNTIFQSGLTSNTISATTYYNLPTDIRVTGGTYTNGTATFTNNTGGTFNVTGFAIGGGGGQIFYLNLSQSQNGNRFLSTTASTASEQTSGVTIGSSVTGSIASFQTTPLNISLIPGGIWSFYLHSYKQDNNSSFNIFVEVYKITSGGSQTLLFATDPAPVTTNSPNPSMQLTDGYFSGTSLNVSDGVVAVVKATNTGNQSHSITLVTEGSQHYSYVVSTIPTQQELTCETLSGCSIIQTINTDISNKFDKSGGTVSGATNFTSGLTANTISATTYSNLPSQSGTGISAFAYVGSTGLLTITKNDTTTLTAGTFSYLTAATLSDANVLSVASNGGSPTTTTINAVTGGTYSSGTLTLSGTGNFQSTITGFSTGTVTSITSGTGMNFSNITTSGSVSIDTTKVPYYSGGFSSGFARYSGSSWVFDNSTYLTSALTATTLSAANVLSVTSSNGSPTTTTINAVTGGTYSNGTITLSGTGNFAASITGFSTGSTGGAGITWNNSTTAQTASVSNGYVGTATTLTTITLPSTAAFGSVIEVVGTGTGLWRISQNSGQSIKFGVSTTATGVGGYLSATSQYDCVKLLCTSADTTFVVTSAIGNIFYI